MSRVRQHLEQGGYLPLKLLGEGTFGRVYLCRNKALRQLCCVKDIDLQMPNSDDARDLQAAYHNRLMVTREIYLLSNLQHPRIVRCDEYFERDGHMYIVMEYAAAGNLLEFIQARLEKSRLLSSPRIIRYFCDILLGLEYLHKRQVIHRDLKPENILMAGDGRLKIADFGVSKIQTERDRKQLATYGAGTCTIGTWLFLAPEVLLSHQSTYSTDIWALGCILYELCTLYSPFEGCRSWKEVYKMARRRAHHESAYNIGVSWSRTWTQLFQQLVDRMLAFDVEQRASMGWLMRHPAVRAFLATEA